MQRLFWADIDVQYAGATGLLIAQGLKQVRTPRGSNYSLTKSLSY